MIATDALVPELAQRLAPIGMFFGIVCWLRRSHEIGGWLLFFYYQIYAGALVSVLLVVRSIRVYLPHPWKNETHHLLFILAVIPRLIGFLIVVGVATILLKRRDLAWVQNLRLVLGIELFLSVMAVAIDFVHFPSAAAFNCSQTIMMAVWLVYFYSSQRVHQVFITHDWGTPPLC